MQGIKWTQYIPEVAEFVEDRLKQNQEESQMLERVKLIGRNFFPSNIAELYYIYVTVVLGEPVTWTNIQRTFQGLRKWPVVPNRPGDDDPSAPDDPRNIPDPAKDPENDPETGRSWGAREARAPRRDLPDFYQGRFPDPGEERYTPKYQQLRQEANRLASYTESSAVDVYEVSEESPAYVAANNALNVTVGPYVDVNRQFDRLVGGLEGLSVVE
jgi:hypothetical protein